MTPDSAMLKSNLTHLQSTFRQFLKDFASSKDTFRIVQSISTSQSLSTSSSAQSTPDPNPPQLQTLYVLDSSFNPPHRAHALLAQNAVLRDSGSRPARVLLLLATQNADKAPKPAAYEDRLVMMTLVAEEMRRALTNVTTAAATASSSDEGKGEGAVVDVDVGITKKPFFVDKAQAIDDSGVYGDTTQVHLTGFDTLVRIFDTKYYPPEEKLGVLAPFLERHRVRAAYREEEGEGGEGRKEQERYVEQIGDGSREREGMQREWKRRVELADDAMDGKGVSSTKARSACQIDDDKGRRKELERFVSAEVARYIEVMGLYSEEKEAKEKK